MGRTGLEEIKDTQKLPGPVPLVIPQSLRSREPAGNRAGTTSRGPRQRPSPPVFRAEFQDHALLTPAHLPNPHFSRGLDS